MSAERANPFSRRAFLRRTALGAGAVVAGGTLGAFGDSLDVLAATSKSAWKQVVSAAKSEGTLQVYAASTPTAVQAFETDFKELYGINLNILLGDSATVNQKLQAEHNAGIAGADAAIQTDPLFTRMAASGGYFAPLLGPHVLAPVAKSDLAAQALYVTVSLATFGYAWNTQAIHGKLPFQHIVQSKYKGKIGMLDYTTSPTLVLLVYDMGQELLKQYGIKNPYVKLANLQPKFYPGQTAILNDLAAGEIDIATQAVQGSVPPNSPIKVAYPKNALGLPVFASVLKSGKHVNAAQVFVDYLMSPRGQEIQANNSVSAIPGIKNAVLSRSGIGTLIDSSSVPTDQLAQFKSTLVSDFHRGTA